VALIVIPVIPNAGLPVASGKLPTDQLSVVTCVGSIALRHFAPGELLVVSTPQLHGKHPHGTAIPHTDDFAMVDRLLEDMNSKELWPVLTTQQNDSVCESEASGKHDSYILFLWKRDERMNALNTLRVQLHSLEECEHSFNRRGKFLVVVTDTGNQNSHDLAKDIISTMWERERIANLLVMVCSDSRAAQPFAFDLYTWFPYEPGQCGQVNEIVLLDRCASVGLLHNSTYFPSKVPQHLAGCPIKVSVSHMSPYVIQTHNDTGEDGSITYRYRGIEIEYLLILTEKMNLSLVYLPPNNDHFMYRLMYQLQDVKDVTADVTLGFCPLIPFSAAYGDPTMPYFYSTIQWYVPCAKPAARQIFRMFTPPVWLAVSVVFILTCVIFWGSSNGASATAAMESSSFRTLASCFQSALAVSLGLAVPQRPVSSRLRMFFLLSVWYSFFMSIVFQVSFTSFIVEPGYENQIHTFEELIESRATFAIDTMTKVMALLSSYRSHMKLKGPVVGCSDQAACLERYLKEDGITTIAPQFQAQYMASMVGTTAKRGRLLCTIDKNIASGGLAMILTRGHPLLDRFNQIIQHSFEGGLVKKYWRELTLSASLRKAATSADSTSGSLYTAFTTTHLCASFYVLCAGLLLSFVVFLGELVT
jgi:hypothetical protein